MNWTTSCLESRKAKVRFLKAGGWGKVTVNKRKERMVSGQVSFFQDKDLSCRLPFLPADCLTGNDSKFIDWLIKIVFLVKVETAVRY